MKQHCMWSKLVLGLGLASASFMTFAQSLADQPSSEAADGSVLEEIVVTGSRIAGSNVDSPIPVQVLSALDIEASGSVDLGEIVTQLPGVYLGLSPTNTLLSTQNAGLSTIDLRALGSNRTLTLINGHRVVSNSGSTQAVDVGTIPSAFVERIDITTGGASAVYGSDAIAGVANIMLVNSYTGAEIDVRYGDSDEGGGETTSIDAAYGIDFGNGNGNFMIGVMWDERKPLWATDRDFALNNMQFDIETGEFYVDKSSFLPGGRFEVGDAWNNNGVWQNDVVGSQYCLDDGRVPPCDDYQTELDGYDFRPDDMIDPYRERSALMSKLTYSFNNQLTGWAVLQYTTIDTSAQRAAATVQDADSYGPFDNQTVIGELANNHPFIHPAVKETLSGTVDWRRRFNEVGQRFRASTRDTTRVQAGLDGAFSDKWSWSAYVGYGEFEQDQKRENEINKLKLDLALDIEEIPDNPGSYRCVDADARANGCVPLDFFGTGSISTAAADYIRATDRLNQKLKQTTASFTVNGSLWELPAGAILTAFGLDYRKEKQHTTGDPDTNAGLTTTGFIPDIQGDFDVYEGFVELQVPLIADKPGVHALDLTTAVRLADYSTVGGVSSWNLGLSYAPTESIRFRTQVSQAQRAPDITELFSSPRSDFDDLNDPCNNVTATSTGTIAENCRQEPGVAAAISTEGIFIQDGTSIFGPNTGNPELQEETGRTFTIGTVITPTSAPGLSIIIDYYDIKVEDVISSVDSQLAADLCYSDPGYPNNTFCDSITRSGDGQVERIVNQVENLNELKAEGLDVSVNYAFEIPKVSGDFAARLVYSHIYKNEESFDGPQGEEIDTFAGEVGLPEDQALFNFSWTPTDTLFLRYRLNYTGSAVDNLRVDPGDIAYLKVGSWTTHDIYASYQLGLGSRTDLQLYAGINNIGNDNGPYLPDEYKHGTNQNIHPAYDRVGRRYYIGAKLMWQ